MIRVQDFLLHLLAIIAAGSCLDAFVLRSTTCSKSHIAAAAVQVQSSSTVQDVLDFESSELAPNAISSIKWSSSGQTVSPNSYRLGLDPKLTESLLEYCNDTGITKVFWSLLVNNNPLDPDTYTTIASQCDATSWFVQRPETKWSSNAHWISPKDEAAHDEYLKVLSKGGFDKTLEVIGKRFDFNGLVAYHLSFIGVSHCTHGYLHHDFTEVEGKGFNLIIPLMLAKNTAPELDISELQQLNNNKDAQKTTTADDDVVVGRYKYTMDEANMVGDYVGHATSACDYLEAGDMRIAATVYIADVNAGNAERLVKYFTQNYPPKKDLQHLLDRAGSHWKHDDPTKQLPT
mmetsp:Transcript_24552/g.36402  ORF Transcript_24552/g.36402 Transcript_24552/m.36402 type:complete len:346 (-) Transcript_24552:223-1260(-)